MKEVNTTPGKSYAVTSPNGCTVTVHPTLPAIEIPAGIQTLVVAQSGKMTVSDDAAVLTEVFKSALAPCQLGGSEGVLPVGYRRCEYLESTGTQHIDTGIIPIATTSIEAEFSHQANKQKELAFYGAHSGMSWGLYLSYPWKSTLRGGTDKANLDVNFSDFSEPLKIHHDDKLIHVNDEIVFDCSHQQIQRIYDTLYLFARHNNKNTTNYGKVKCYSFKVFDAGVLQLNFIPCLDDTGTPCMFDTVSRTAFYNQGASVEEGGKDFLYKLKVPDARKLPYGYYPLSYLESTGTQWIQTDIFPQEYLVAEVDSQFTQINGNRQLFGLASAFLYTGIEANGKWNYLNKDSDLLRHIFRLTIERSSGNKSRFISDVTETLNSNGPPATSADLRLMPFSLENGTFNCHLRCYGAKMYGDGELICDLQPCLNADGEPVMYDFVSGKDFKNQGTGQFLYEAPAALASMPMTLALRPEEPQEYGILTEHGLRRLYKVPHTIYFLPAQLKEYAWQNGYKPIVETEQPETGYWQPVWREDEDEIVLEWVETEPVETEEAYEV